MSKRYFWIKLSVDFFRQHEMKKLRRKANGELLTLIYLKMLLLTADKDGYLEYHEKQDFVEELALDIDEAEEDVAACLEFLAANGLVEECGECGNKKFFPKVQEMTGSESASANRMRKLREKASHCDGHAEQPTHNVTLEKESDIELYTEPEGNQSESESKNVRAHAIAPVHRYWQENFSKLTNGVAEIVDGLLAEYGEERMMYAMKEAVADGVTTAGYVRTICEADAQGRSRRCRRTAVQNVAEKNKCSNDFDAALDAELQKAGLSYGWN